MITSPLDYYNALLQVKDKSKPNYAILLPTDETIYNIDLNTRKVQAPKYLGVESDIYAETIYFKVDRFFDNMDLADTTCSIQYINNGIKDDTGNSYLVPFFDVTTYKKEQKILIPWQISNIVTKAPGDITFSFRFFKLNESNKNIYELNTLPASSKILKGINIDLEGYDDEYKDADIISNLQNRINELSNQVGTYWIEI